MGHACVFGLGWGDEGKGKVVDLLCPAFDYVVRFNGGANAGHTVCVGDRRFALHLLPAGILHPSVTGVIGAGVVVDSAKLIEELDGLIERGIDPGGRLKISDRAHLVLPYHKIEDQLSEKAALGKKIGTTARGIGPCYADKMRRTWAIRFADLLHDSTLIDRVVRIVEQKRKMFIALYGEDGGLDEVAIAEDLRRAKNRLASSICDTTLLLHIANQDGRKILFEGANGVLLDVDHGTYPFVTSSSTGPHGIGVGSGVPSHWVGRRIGAAKAYATRVGSGPFMTELSDTTGDRIRDAGHEFGTTTGRPRRCGWFDAVACRYAAQVAGLTDIALLHLDTLSGFDEVGLCTAYRVGDQTLRTIPAGITTCEQIKPLVEFLPGWSEDVQEVRVFADLPKNARDYVERIETLVGSPVSLIGVGPKRSQTIIRGDLKSMVGDIEIAAQI